MIIVKEHVGVLGQTIKKLLKERHMTQGELAKQAGVNETSLCRWMEGVHHPTLTNLVIVAATLDVSVDTLLAGWLETEDA